jgi:hypothetical protein
MYHLVNGARRRHALCLPEFDGWSARTQDAAREINQTQCNPLITIATSTLVMVISVAPLVHASTWVGDASEDWNDAAKWDNRLLLSAERLEGTFTIEE